MHTIYQADIKFCIAIQDRSIFCKKCIACLFVKSCTQVCNISENTFELPIQPKAEIRIYRDLFLSRYMEENFSKKYTDLQIRPEFFFLHQSIEKVQPVVFH